MDRVLIAVVTCHRLDYGDHERREHISGENPRVQAIRGGWLKRLPPGVDCKFFFGRPSPIGFISKSDEVLLSCPDDYAHLPSKTVEICRWAFNSGYDWLLKVDDDVEIYSFNLPTEHGDYMGRQQGYMCHGSVYWLSVHAMGIISEVRNPESISWAEDRMVALSLAEHGIKPTNIAGWY